MLERLLNRIKEKAQSRVQKKFYEKASTASEGLAKEFGYINEIILFASVVTGKLRRESDIDLCFVIDDEVSLTTARPEINGWLIGNGFTTGHVPGGFDLFLYPQADFNLPPESRDTMSNADEKRLGYEIEVGTILFSRLK